MACHELAALRLGIMAVLGLDDPGERAHELAELGALAEAPGPLSALTTAANLQQLVALYSTSLVELSERVARAASDEPQLPYWRSLLVLTKKVELELRAQVAGLTRLYQELEEMHDFVHELFPAEGP
jgi:Protein of unknown function (DUF3209)